jgi:hypothetical protein
MEQFVRNGMADSKRQQTSIFISMGMAVFSAIVSFVFAMFRQILLFQFTKYKDISIIKIYNIFIKE